MRQHFQLLQKFVSINSLQYYKFSQKIKLIKTPEKPKKAGVPQEIKQILVDSVPSDKSNSKDAQYQQVLQSITPSNMYQSMDSSFEGFFSKRDYNIKNFNFLIKILGEQRKLNEALQTVEKMSLLRVRPNAVTYNYLIKACGKSKDPKKAEELFEYAVEKYGHNKYLYNSLITVYVRQHNYMEAERIVREMKNQGIKPDIVAMTTLINAYYKGKNIDKCWELWESIQNNPKSVVGKPDVNMLSLMVEICATRHEAEKAVQINKMLEDQPDFMHTTTTYNAIIKALGSRKDYADDALDYFERMKYSDTNMDMDTYVHTIKACTNVGDVNTAFNVLQMMKDQKLQPNKYIYNQVLRTYSGACGHVPMEESTKDLYIKDAWGLLDQIKKLGYLNINTLNSFLTIFVKANRPNDLEGLVLPLYEKFNIEKDKYTYQHIIELYSKHKDLKTVYRVYQKSQEKNIDSTWWTLNYVLDAAVKAEDVDVIVDILNKFLEIKREPKVIYLKRLGEADYLPDKIYQVLQNFSQKFGHLKDSNYSPSKKPLRDSWL